MARYGVGAVGRKRQREREAQRAQTPSYTDVPGVPGTTYVSPNEPYVPARGGYGGAITGTPSAPVTAPTGVRAGGGAGGGTGGGDDVPQDDPLAERKLALQEAQFGFAQSQARERDWAERRKGHQQAVTFGGGGGGAGGGNGVQARTITDRPWDENLYRDLLGDVERFRTQALPDISAAQETMGKRLGMRATAGLGSGPMARAARAQALEPYYARLGMQEADRYMQHAKLLGQMGRGLLTPYGIREIEPGVEEPGRRRGGNPYQQMGGPIMYQGRMIGRA